MATVLPHIRSCFIAPPGHVILAADYKSAELFVMGYLSNELKLVEDAKRDLHARGAVNCLGCPRWEGFEERALPTKDWLKQYKAERIGSKTISFGCKVLDE